MVDGSYIGKVYFDKSLGYVAGQPVPPEQLVSEFTITADGSLIPRSDYTFIRDETGTESALAFRFPNLYTGNPDDLHEIRATQQRGDVTLTDTRLVKAAVGAIVDSDGDGLPDYWEQQNRLDLHNPDGEEGANGDKDGDGISNVLEFLEDLNPQDPGDGLQSLCPIVSRNGATWQLLFRVIPNRRYQIETSTNFVFWSNSGPSFTVPAADPSYRWTDPAPAAATRFYRVKISLP